MRRAMAAILVFLSAGVNSAGAQEKSKILTIEDVLVIASSHNVGAVSGNFSSAARDETDATMYSSFDGVVGSVGQSQNAGSNSLLENDLSLAYVGECSNCAIGAISAKSIIIGSARNVGTVTFNEDYPGYAVITSSGNGGGTGGNGGGTGGNGGGTGGNGGGTGGGGPQGVILVPQGTDPYDILSNSFNGGVGIFSAMQNAGANSQEQTSESIGSLIVAAGQLTSKLYGVANNDGRNQNNTSVSYSNPTWEHSTDSFNTITGVGNFTQNTASNSLLQNSTAINTIQFKTISNAALSSVDTNSKNLAHDQLNSSESMFSWNEALMSQNFNGSTGILQTSQNVGSNSLLQNASSVSAFGLPP